MLETRSRDHLLRDGTYSPSIGHTTGGTKNPATANAQFRGDERPEFVILLMGFVRFKSLSVGCHSVFSPRSTFVANNIPVCCPFFENIFIFRYFGSVPFSRSQRIEHALSLACARTHTCMHAHTHTRMHARRHTHVHTHAHTHAHKCARTHTLSLSHTYNHTLTHRHTHTHTYMHTNTHSHTYTHTFSLSLFFSLSHTHTQAYTHTHVT